MSSTATGPAPHRAFAPRPHTGRRRNAAARDAILDATFDLLRAQGTSGVTIDAIAAGGRGGTADHLPVVAVQGRGRRRGDDPRRAGDRPAPGRPARSPGTSGSFLTDSFAGLQDPGTRRALRQLASAAVHDEHVAGVLAEFTAQRRAALGALLERGVASGDIASSADLGMLVDLAYGVLWYRLLVGHAPLDAERGPRPRHPPHRGRAGRSRRPRRDVRPA